MIMTVFPDVLQKSEPVCLSGDDSVFAAARLMRQHHVGTVLVMADGRLDGIFTERDLSVRMVARGFDPSQTTIAEVMTPEVETVAADDTVIAVLERMERGGHRHFPVVAGAGLIGVIAARDLVRASSRQFETVLDDMSVTPIAFAGPISDVLPGKAVVRATPETPVRAAAQTMGRDGVGAVLVTDGTWLLGILTERDIAFRVVAEARDPADTPLAAVMTPDPVTASHSDPCDAVLARMIAGGFRHVPVMDGARVAGVVSYRDLYGLARHALETQFCAAMRTRAQRMAAAGE